MPASDSGARPRTPETNEPVAIIGIGCRYPGGIASPEELWDFVAAGRCSVGEMPRDRGWNLERLQQDGRRTPGSSATRFGHFIEDATGFDPEFFGVSPGEATAMHPAQRLLLMTAWEAMERAGIAPSTLSGRDVGVFAGVASPEYGPRWHEAPREVKGKMLTGTVPSAVAGRLSYTFGFRGPSISLDTACSSSSVALHLACQSLRNGETSLALAGGVTFHGTPGSFSEFTPSRVLSGDGISKPFSDSADGVGWGEGAGMLLLARLSDAQRLGYPVLAVVRGSAVNQDGASSRFSAPSGEAQELLIRQALADAGLRARDVDVVEAHGTGTPLGDPIEANAVIATYGQDRPADQPVYLGSLKSNVGHTLAAAGVGGIIKMVMAFRNGVMPQTLHVQGLNRRVDWSADTVRVLTESRPWPPGERPRRAGISSFGVTGTNAHTILEEALFAPSRAVPVPLVLSARSEQALRAQADRLRQFVAQRADASLSDIGYSLAMTREHFEHRAAVVAGQREYLLGALETLAEGTPDERVFAAVSRAAGRPVFVFPGQGAQWEGMAAQLLDTSEVFARRIRECADALAPYCDWSLMDVLGQAPGAASLERVDVVQPALFAVMVSLAELWASYGIRPAAVVGHSQGEIAAACVSGALSLQDAAKVVALRSRELAAITGDHGMASTALSPAELERYLAGQNELTIAVCNAPRATVVAGPRTRLTDLLALLETEGVRARLLPVDYASHSAQVESIRERVIDSLSDITPSASGIPFYSTVVGGLIDTSGLDGKYWYTNLRQTVRFADTVRAVLDDEYRHFIEVSPHPVLFSPIEAIAEDAEVTEAVVVATLVRDDGGMARFAHCLAEAHVNGLVPDWDAVFAAEDLRRLDLPTYPFQNRRFWIDDSPADASPVRATSDAQQAGHAFLTEATELADTDAFVFSGSLSLHSQPWLADHSAQGLVLLPGAAVIELVARAADGAGCASIADLTLESPLVLMEDEAPRLQVSVGSLGIDGRRTVSVYSRPEKAPRGTGWTRHAEGTLDTAEPPAADIGQWPPSDAESVDPTALYDRLAAAGVEYGAAFRTVERCWRRGSTLLAEVALPAAWQHETARFGLHPTLLDGALHVLGLELFGTEAGTALMPFEWTGVCVRPSNATRLRVLAEANPDGGYRILTVDPAGQAVLSVSSISLMPVPDGWADEQGRRREAARSHLPEQAERITETQRTGEITAPAALVDDLTGLSYTAQRRRLADLVRAHTATVLGLESPDSIAPDQPFKNFGMESLGAVELRRRLSAAIGKRLAAAVVFDHATPTRLAEHIRGVLFPEEAPQAQAGHPDSTDPTFELAKDSLAETDGLSTIDAMDVDALLAMAAAFPDASADSATTNEDV